MEKATAHRKHSHHNNYDLTADLEKIKNAFSAAAFDVKGKTHEMLNQSVEDLKEKSTQMRDGLSEYTAEKPLKSLGIALLAGFVIGFLVRK
ncbi:MAG: hypothetical protein A3E84_01810 [Gammaproteobacteria bacterium RIFCSPHIGHO2_12_FULL_42_13]|nr:MAG: hypothetical protein A3E84_01810 [Gammaproteobacteria bacterium RIFCSPHIGHO2_12_FULL_42_13]